MKTTFSAVLLAWLCTACSASPPVSVLPAPHAVRAGVAASHLYVLQSLPAQFFSEAGTPPAINDPAVSVYAAGLSKRPVRKIADQVFGPAAIATDQSGTLYVAFETSNRRNAQGGAIEIFKRGSKKPERVIAGPATGLSAPQSIAVGSGKIYVGNLYNGNLPSSSAPNLGSVTVYAQDAKGNAEPEATIAGQKTGIGNPVGLLADASGNVYVLSRGGFGATSLGGMLLVFTGNQDGDVEPAYEGAATGSSYPTNYPVATAIGSYGGDIAVLAGGGTLGTPCQSSTTDYVAIFGAGAGVSQPPANCYPVGATGAGFAPCGSGFWVGTSTVDHTTGTQAGALEEYTSNGSLVTSVHGPATGIDEIRSIACIAGRPTIANVTTGTIETFSGGAGGNAVPSATIDTNPIHLFAPTGIAVDSDGAVIVADAGSPYGAVLPRVTIFAPYANGEEAPERVITGSWFLPWNTACGPPLHAVAVDARFSIYVSQLLDSRCVSSASAVAEVGVFGTKSGRNAKPTRTIHLPTRTDSSSTAFAVGLGLAIDGEDQLYASGPNAVDVFRAGASTSYRTIVTNDPQGYLSSSAVDSNGDIVVTGRGSEGSSGSSYGSSVDVILVKGTTRTISGIATKLDGATQAAFAPNGGLYVANGYVPRDSIVKSAVLSFAANAKGDVRPRRSASFFNYITGLAVGP